MKKYISETDVAARLIRYVRLDEEWTLEDVSAALQTTIERIMDIENGINNLTINELSLMITHLGYNLSKFFFMVNDVCNRFVEKNITRTPIRYSEMENEYISLEDIDVLINECGLLMKTLKIEIGKSHDRV